MMDQTRRIVSSFSTLSSTPPVVSNVAVSTPPDGQQDLCSIQKEYLSIGKYFAVIWGASLTVIVLNFQPIYFELPTASTGLTLPKVEVWSSFTS